MGGKQSVGDSWAGSKCPGNELTVPVCGLGSGFPAVTVSTASRQEVGRAARRLGCCPWYPF